MAQATTGGALGVLRRVNRLLAGVIVVALMFSIAVLILPVTLQIFSRYTELIPSYIWTEEMARFMFIWTIMLGAMASRFIAVSTSVSPFTTLDEAMATLRVSALRRFSAISNEVRVRVLGS